MQRDWRDLKTPEERLVWAREAAGYEMAADAAAAMGMTGSAASTYFGHENGSRGLSRAGARYADFFRVSFNWLMQGKGIPKPNTRPSAWLKEAEAANILRSIKIIGRAGAGPEESIKFEDETDLGEAPPIPNASETTAAIEIWGTSMRPMANDGWLVYYDDRRDRLTNDMLGQPCVIGLENGHTVIKTPQPGTKRGFFHLESANPAVDTMRDQRVLWAALVTAIVPRVPARKLQKFARGTAST